jgi:hypothetical protein
MTSSLPKALLLLASHLLVLALGFGLGIYALPLLTAPPAPTAAEVGTHATQASFRGRFVRDLTDSDALHWGEGEVSIGPKAVALMGEVAPGPDYKLYLSPQFVQTEEAFLRLKPTMVRVGDVKTFKNFIVPLPDSVDPARYNTVVVWCESFGQFISAAQYR